MIGTSAMKELKWILDWIERKTLLFNETTLAIIWLKVFTNFLWFKIELFAKIVNGWKIIYYKRLHLRFFTGFWALLWKLAKIAKICNILLWCWKIALKLMVKRLSAQNLSSIATDDVFLLSIDLVLVLLVLLYFSCKSFNISLS